MAESKAGQLAEYSGGWRAVQMAAQSAVSRADWLDGLMAGLMAGCSVEQ